MINIEVKIDVKQLIWQTNKYGTIQADPEGLKWFYCICFARENKQFELLRIYEDLNLEDEYLITLHSSILDAKDVAQKHFETKLNEYFIRKEITYNNLD